MEMSLTDADREVGAGWIENHPSDEELEEWMFDGVAEATDGCRVEPDGTCEHGCQSWLLVLGLI